MKGYSTIFFALAASTSASADENYVETVIVGDQNYTYKIEHHQAFEKGSHRELDLQEPFTINDDDRIFPMVFHDHVTGNYFYVESDGRHITASSPEGVVLWHRNPFVDSHLVPYRYTKPVIYKIGRASDGGRIFIFFTSSQFGILDEKTGDFDFGGQN